MLKCYLTNGNHAMPSGRRLDRPVRLSAPGAHSFSENHSGCLYLLPGLCRERADVRAHTPSSPTSDIQTS